MASEWGDVLHEAMHGIAELIYLQTGAEWNGHSSLPQALNGVEFRSLFARLLMVDLCDFSSQL
jgi:hypothetical protein